MSAEGGTAYRKCVDSHVELERGGRACKYCKTRGWKAHDHRIMRVIELRREGCRKKRAAYAAERAVVATERTLQPANQGGREEVGFNIIPIDRDTIHTTNAAGKNRKTGWSAGTRRVLPTISDPERHRSCLV